MMTKRNRRQIDPIAALVERRTEGLGGRPASLAKVRLEVEFKGGLVIASVIRTYRNRTDRPIEAVLSFPAPSSAICYELTAEADGRLLSGVGAERGSARTTYERGIDSGRAAFLYEEVLRGIHMLSVGNLAPRASVEVTVRWVDSILVEGRRAWYRIPMTLGQVYGQSGLPETDEPVLGGRALEAELRLRHDARALMLDGGALDQCEDGTLRATVATDTPIDVRLDGWKTGCLAGRSALGRDVQVEFMPCSAGTADLDVAVLVDVSGSMAGPSEGQGRQRGSKHSAMMRALRSLASRVRSRDRLSLWAFNNTCRRIGAPPEHADPFPTGRNLFLSLVGQLGPPDGGTEIGEALKTSEDSGNRDVLLITDGLSYELDVLDHAKSGRRVFVILVGEDSLDAKVGHLAALTGGGVYYSFGGDVTRTVMAALRRLRDHWEEPQTEGSRSDGLPETIRTVRGNAAIEVRWGEEREASRAEPIERAVAAFSAGITLPCLSGEAAKGLAIGQGIVTHLSSLVLVDDEGKVQDLLPDFERVKLPYPRTHAGGSPLASRMHFYHASNPPLPAPDPAKTLDKEDGTAGMERPWLEQMESTKVGAWLRATGRMVDWTRHRSALEAGRLEELPLVFAMMIRILARHPLVRQIAAERHLIPAQAAIALVACAVADRSKAAGTVRDSLLGTCSEKQLSGVLGEFQSLRREDIESLVQLPSDSVP